MGSWSVTASWLVTALWSAMESWSAMPPAACLAETTQVVCGKAWSGLIDQEQGRLYYSRPTLVTLLVLMFGRMPAARQVWLVVGLSSFAPSSLVLRHRSQAGTSPQKNVPR